MNSNRDRGFNIVPMAARVYLNVPFSDKEEAKALGCRWDQDRKKWYCIDSNYGKSNVTECVERWGNFAYKLIDDQKIMLADILPSNRGFTSISRHF